jgi:DNA recombination protein RmuC
MTYAFAKRVVPVSPNSFYVYLHTVSLGLRGLEVEENARRIMDGLDRLKVEFGRFREEFGKLGGHLTNARGKFEEAEKRLARLEEKLVLTDERAVEELAAPKEDL